MSTSTRATGNNKKFKDLLNDVLPDSEFVAFASSEKETEFLDMSVKLVLSLDSEYNK